MKLYPVPSILQISKYSVIAMQQGGHRTGRTIPFGTDVAFLGSWQMHMTVWGMYTGDTIVDHVSSPMPCLYSKWPGPAASVEENP